MRQALFFLRHYNDIDHMVPVIHKAAEAGHPCMVILAGFDDVGQDYRIRFIASRPGVEVVPLSSLLSRAGFLRFRLICLMLYARASGQIRPGLFRLLQSVWPEQRRRRLWQQVSEKILDRAFGAGAGVVAFDWITAKSTLAYEFVSHFLQQARERGCVSLSLPHGDSPHYSEMIRNEELRIEPQTKYAAAEIFDYVVCPNELCARRYRPFLNADRIQVLGSARYSEEWLAVLDEIAPKATIPQPSGELRLVMFLRKPEFSLFWEEIERVLRMIGQMEGVRLLLKPHTRDFRQQPIGNILKNTRAANIAVAPDEWHSVSLLAWADGVIDLATSVSFEAIRRGIPVLSAEYLHAAFSAIAHYVPETAVHYRDQLYQGICRLRDQGSEAFYDEAHRQAFISNMLDVPDDQVLTRYVALLARAGGMEDNPA